MRDIKIDRAIERLAEGFSSTEVTSEYALEDGELKLVKKREVKKDVPPDMKAIMFLIGEENLSLKSEEELIKEKNRLERLEKELNENG